MADEMQTAIQALKAKLESKRRETAAIEEAILNLEQVMRMVSPESVVTSTEYKDVGIAESAKRFVSALGRTASTREIAEALLKGGITTSSKNFTMTVYTILRESPDFKREGNGWALKGRK